MKFPLKERPFELLKFEPPRLEALQALAADLVETNLNEFHDFIHVQNRSLPRTKYKPVKKHDKVIIYKELSAKGDRVLGPHGKPNPHGAPLLPKLIAAGTVRGRMDDMLLGTAVRDAMSVVVKTSYVDDEIVDCGVHEIEGSTREDPFRYVAVKWVVKAHPSGLNSVVAPRDMILVQSSGLIASEGIGYHLLHSVDEMIPEFGSLEDKYGILRARISTMFMFRQLAPEVIECYTVNYVEPNGSAPEAVTIMSTAASMGGVWKSLDCAYNMKLSWILKNKEAYMGRQDPSQTLNTGDSCELCHKKPTLTGRLADCSLCDARVCSRCRVSKKLSKANRRLELKVEKHDFCKTCLFRTVNEDAVRIASEMNVGEPITPWFQVKDPNNRTFSYAGSSVSDNRSSHSSHGSGGSGGSNRGGYMPRPKLHRDTVSTASTSGLYSDRSRDLESFGFSRLVDKDVRAPSIASSSMTDLDFDGHEFHDNDAESVILEPLEDDEAWEMQQYQAYLAQEHAKKKRELEQQYQQQLQALEESKQELQLTTYRGTRKLSSENRLSGMPRLPSRADIDEMKFAGPPEDHVAALYARMKSLQMEADRTLEITRDNERKLGQRTQRQWTN